MKAYKRLLALGNEKCLNKDDWQELLKASVLTLYDNAEDAAATIAQVFSLVLRYDVAITELQLWQDVNMYVCDVFSNPVLPAELPPESSRLLIAAARLMNTLLTHFPGDIHALHTAVAWLLELVQRCEADFHRSFLPEELEAIKALQSRYAAIVAQQKAQVQQLPEPEEDDSSRARPFRSYWNYANGCKALNVLRVTSVLPSCRELIEDTSEQDRRQYIRELPPVAVDEPLGALTELSREPLPAFEVHRAIQFALVHEDFVSPLRGCFDAANRQQLGRQAGRQAVGSYVVTFESLNPTCEGLRFTFKLDAKLLRPRFLSKRLKNGNFVALVPLDENNCPCLDRIRRGILKRKTDKKLGRDRQDDALLKDGLFEIDFEDSFFPEVLNNSKTTNVKPRASRPLPATRQSYLMVESTAFFLPYERVLRILKQPCHLQEQFKTALMTGVTAPPPYVVRARQIGISDAIMCTNYGTQDGDIPVSPLEAQWDGVVDYTPEREREVKPPCAILDPTQLASLQYIFQHNVAVVQGTPGTGKTFVGAKFLQIVLNNAKEGLLNCGPILVMCYTQHALDSFLLDLVALGFAKDMVRLGPPSKNEALQPLAFNLLVERDNSHPKGTRKSKI